MPGTTYTPSQNRNQEPNWARDLFELQRMQPLQKRLRSPHNEERSAPDHRPGWYRIGDGRERGKRPHLATQSTALPSSPNIVHVWIDGSYLNQVSKVKRSRAGLGVHFPQTEFGDLSTKAFGIQTNNRAEAMACLRVLPHVHRPRDLHVHTDLKW